jgi:hypothetical protein
MKGVNIMDKLQWLLVSWRNLTWWQMILWVVYLFYFCIRTHGYWSETKHGLRKGYRHMIFGYSKEVRLYHILLIIFDLPQAIIGLTFPALRKLLSFKIYEFKDNNKGGIINENKN